MKTTHPPALSRKPGSHVLLLLSRPAPAEPSCPQCWVQPAERAVSALQNHQQGLCTWVPGWQRCPCVFGFTTASLSTGVCH